MTSYLGGLVAHILCRYLFTEKRPIYVLHNHASNPYFACLFTFDRFFHWPHTNLFDPTWMVYTFPRGRYGTYCIPIHSGIVQSNTATRLVRDFTMDYFQGGGSITVDYMGEGGGRGWILTGCVNKFYNIVQNESKQRQKVGKKGRPWRWFRKRGHWLVTW